METPRTGSVQVYCRPCGKQHQKENKWSHTLKQKSKYMLKAAKERSVKKNLPFDIDISDVEIPATCPVLGILLVIARRGRSGWYDDSPSLDRKKPELGYTKGNVQVISNRANRLKADGTVEELEKVLEYVKSCS